MKVRTLLCIVSLFPWTAISGAHSTSLQSDSSDSRIEVVTIGEITEIDPESRSLNCEVRNSVRSLSPGHGDEREFRVPFPSE